MTEIPREGIEYFLEIGRGKVEAEEQASERRLEAVRVRLVTAARVVVDKYQSELQAAVPQLGQSYSTTIRPFWERLLTLGIRDQLVSAGFVGYGAGLVADPILYEWPFMAQRALTEGGIFPPNRDEDDLEDERLTRAVPIKPCQFDAEEILDPSFAQKQSQAHEEEIVLECYRGEDQAEVYLEKNGLVIYRVPRSPIGQRGRYDYEHYAYRFNPSQDELLPALPNYIHPRVINDFASQIRSGRCDEHVGALLVRASRRLGKQI